jgi:hypothetical protein
MVRLVAKVLGAVFILIGVLGFVPALTPDGNLLGIFHVNTLHNIIHLASGLVALVSAYSSVKAAKLYFQVFGVVYGLVAVLGFVYGDNAILGLVANNLADTLLHVVIAGTALALGFGNFASKEVTA